MLQPLHLAPDAQAWVVAASWPVLMAHISAGLTALPAGAVAIAARKGSRLHRAAGKLFFLSMLVMLGVGGLIAAFEPGNRGTAVGALFGIYLVITAWSAARRPDGPAGQLERAGFWFVLAVGLTMLALIAIGMANPNPQPHAAPWQAAAIMGVIALLSAAADRRVIRKGMAGADRIARHLWRMCGAFFFASGSFFLGQQKVMPQAIQGSPILIVLAVAPLVLMIFWLIYVRFSKKFGGRPPAAPHAIQPAGL
jgi:uncharacterized membrane protein